VSSRSVEIITGRERRRRWSIEEKLRIVAESNEAGSRVTEVAAQHGVYPSLLFTWRRQVRDGLLVTPPPARFVPVRMLSPEPASEAAAGRIADDRRHAPAAETPRRADMIEIILANGCQLRFDQHIDARALRRILGVLRG
jgi:transposase